MLRHQLVVFLIVRTEMIWREVKDSKDHEAFSTLRKQRLDYPKNVILGHLNISKLRKKFDSISEMIIGKVENFLINGTKLDEPVSNNQFVKSSYKFIQKDRNKFGGGMAFCINAQK